MIAAELAFRERKCKPPAIKCVIIRQSYECILGTTFITSLTDLWDVRLKEISLKRRKEGLGGFGQLTLTIVIH